MQIHLRVGDERGIAPCSTRALCLVNAKLRVVMTADWTDTWYKDEGGRDKCMEGDVTLWNERNEQVMENLDLDLTLYYAGESHVIVSNQELLRRIGAEQKLQIDGNTGSGKIRFRVEDVSKNHQGQNFVVKVSPVMGAIKDVAPVFTPPVSVRSKRNRQKQRPSVARPSEQPPAELNLPTPPSDSGRRSSVSETGIFEGADPIRLRNAVQAIVRWADEVVTSLYYMQWQVIGYEHRPDGTMDYNRPLHNIHNPNPTIERVLTLYNESVRDDLGYLQGVVEQNAVARTTASAAARAASYNAPAPQPIRSMCSQSQTPSYARGMPAQHFTHAGDFHQYAVSQQQQQQQQPQQSHPYPPYFYPPVQQQAHAVNPTTRESPVDDRKTTSVDRESKVEFVLAKQYKSVRTGERLGFPAFSADHEILGFYRESTTNVGANHFDPIQRHDFGPAEKHDAKRILGEAIANKSNAVHALKDWESMASLINHCLVYNFSKDIDSNSGSDTNC